MAVGLIVLIGYFIPNSIVGPIRSLILDWAITLAAIAGLVAILNLTGVHWRKISDKRNRDFYSIFLVLAFWGTFLAGIATKVMGVPSQLEYQRVVTAIQQPIESSLMAMLAISLAYASFRLLQRRKGLMAVIFVISAVVFLIILSGLLSFGSNVPLLSPLINFVNLLPVAGARGILLGIALGSLTTGLRILMGTDRPYSG
jgi:heme A synthase